MDWMMMIVMYILPSLLSGVGGWFVGKNTKRKQKNDILQEMQASIDLLLDRNKTAMNELINLRGEVAQLKGENTELRVDVVKMTKENAALRVEVEELNHKLEDVKTITFRK